MPKKSSSKLKLPKPPWKPEPPKHPKPPTPTKPWDRLGGLGSIKWPKPGWPK